MSCWNWFRPGDQARGAGEPAILAGLTESLRDEFSIPRDRIFAAGLSAGGAMAAILGETYPDLYAAIGVHSGLAHGAASDVVSAFGAMKGQGGLVQRPVPTGVAENGPRVIVFHGGADTTVHPSNGDRVIAGHGGQLATMERLDEAATGERRGYARRIARRADGRIGLEHWLVEGAQHAWAGGDARGSYTDPRGPDASAEMARFFLD
jgi:poly(3-hydroxybutyrate) depolymerase